MNILIKILQNNLDEREIRFHVFDTFLRLMPEKSESLKNKRFANQHNVCSSILFLCNTTFLLLWSHTE